MPAEHRAPTAADPFVIHFQFRIALWRARRGCARIESALAATRLPEVSLTLHLGTELIATVSLPCGTLGAALAGTPDVTSRLNAAWELVEALADLEPVFALGPPQHGNLLHAGVRTLGVTQALREVYDGAPGPAWRGGLDAW
ncbi:hypothetical protein N8J89_16180 [Crossiella sp. CA-258035]|uniref:hypothetical protein n=1 Tax=Crossiella sp. CA-258035 TaxID=2981138 RepID=UPI0024BC3FDC|nr:hypothetical protein [Crossiella sp. CA-258035]WHT22538.1 hypothetical protein N8J89_16180 [Crossiella sp. CA-258035]